MARLAHPLIARAVELSDQALSIHEATMAAQREPHQDDQAKMQAAVEGATRLKTVATQLNRLLEQAQSQGQKTDRLMRMHAQVQTLRDTPQRLKPRGFLAQPASWRA